MLDYDPGPILGLYGHGGGGGYVHIWSWLVLAVTSVGMAQVGAKAAHLLPGTQLKLIFIMVMFYMGLKMIGVFQWLHLPI